MLRANLYAVLDKVLETGVPAIIERKGQRVRIVPDNAPSLLERLERHDAIIEDPEELVHRYVLIIPLIAAWFTLSSSGFSVEPAFVANRTAQRSVSLRSNSLYERISIP